ncbi:T9SS type A sorting domain-containing protein [Hymenobacter tenuis]
MKNKYLPSHGRGQLSRQWLFALIALLLLPFLGAAQTLSVTSSDPANPQRFGDVATGTTSAAKSYRVEANNLNRDVTVAIPNGFQGSLNETDYSADGVDLTISRNGNRVSTTIYVRFAPTQQRTYDEDLTFTSSGTIAGFIVLGTGIAGSPKIEVSPVALGFQSQVINTSSTPQSVVVTGSSLTNPIVVTAPAGFLVSYNGTTPSSTVSLPVSGGTVNVTFRPTVVKAYIANITFSSEGESGSPSAETKNVQVSGEGLAVPASVTVSGYNSPLSFPDTQEGTASASQTFTVNASGLGNTPLTVTAPTNFQVRIGTNPFSSTATIVPVNGSVANVVVDVRFTPSSTGNKTDNVTITSPNSPTRTVAVEGRGTSAPNGANINVTPTTLAFGNVTQSGSSTVLQLTVSGTNLGSNPITLTPSVSNIQIRNASAGNTAFSSEPLVIPSVSGTVTPVTIEVKLVASINTGAFNQNIVVSSPQAANAVQVTVTANSNGNVSDISITNPANNTFTFATRPTTVSKSQSFLVSGTNLLQDLTIAPVEGTSTTYFQVSKDNVNFSSSVTFQRDANNNVIQAPVYVRFVPGNDAITINALIRATSAPAPQRDVSVTGISQPTVRLLQPIGYFGDDIVKNTTSASKKVRLEAFLLTGPLNLNFPPDLEDPGRNSAGTPQYEFSTDGGLTYVKADTLLNNNEGNRILDLLVRYAPTRVGASTQSLTFQNAAISNGAPTVLTSGNGTANGFAIAEVPGAQSTASIVRGANSTTAVITFNLSNPPAGQSYGQNRLIIASSKYSQLPISLFPQLKQNFTPGTTVNGNYQFGSGSVIEAGNTYVVFSGATSSFTVGNLDPATKYYFYAFEFNDDGLLNAENYKVPNNQPQIPLPVTLVSFDAKVRGKQVALTWVTATELNNKGFEVQRSQDGKSFETILTRAGKGNTATGSTYAGVDEKPLAGLSYYRLKQTDLDGTINFSAPVVVTFLSSGEISMYPNPVTDVLNIEVPGSAAGLRATITDISGRVIRSQVLGADSKLQMSDLQSGTYLVTVGEGTTKVTRRIVRK